MEMNRRWDGKRGDAQFLWGTEISHDTQGQIQVGMQWFGSQLICCLCVCVVSDSQPNSSVLVGVRDGVGRTGNSGEHTHTHTHREKAHPHHLVVTEGIASSTPPPFTSFTLLFPLCCSAAFFWALSPLVSVKHKHNEYVKRDGIPLCLHYVLSSLSDWANWGWTQKSHCFVKEAVKQKPGSDNLRWLYRYFKKRDCICTGGWCLCVIVLCELR